MQVFISYEMTARLQIKNVSFVKPQDFYLAKGPCLLLHPPDMQLWYKAGCYPAVCVPPFTAHHVRSRSSSVWFWCFFSRTGMAQCWQSMAVTTSPLDLWLSLILTQVACFEFLLSMMPYRRSSEFFVPACWCLMACDKCLVSSLVAFFKEPTNQGQSDYSHKVLKPISGSQTRITLPAFPTCLFILLLGLIAVAD